MNVRVYYRSKHKLHRLDLSDVQDPQEAILEARQAIKDPDLMLPQPVGPFLAVIAGESV